MPMHIPQVPEHTWGVDIKKDLADFENWANKDFHAQVGGRDYGGGWPVGGWGFR